jgi:hypothetical protein
MARRGKISQIKGTEVLSEKQVREKGKKVGTIREIFEPVTRRGKKRERPTRRPKDGQRVVVVADKRGVVRRKIVSEELYQEKYAPLMKEDVRMYPGYRELKYKPLPPRKAIVPYDADFAKEQKKKRKLTDAEIKKIQRDAILDNILVSIKKPKWMKVDKKMEEEFGEAYTGPKESAVKAAAAVKESFDKKSVEELKKKEAKKMALVNIGTGNNPEMMKLVVFLIGVILVLGLIAWLASIF